MPQSADDIRDVDELIEFIGARSLTPGWIDREPPLLYRNPSSIYVPVHWRYSEVRPALVAAGRVIGTDLAERRNFVLRNPVPGNDFSTTRTLISAYQSILPGERARSHKHSPHAMRVIIEAHGAYSIVNGHQHPMESGDIVLTPGGSWHGHGHQGSEQAFWFDCLDLPLVHLLEPMTAADHPDVWEKATAVTPDSPMRITQAQITPRLASAPDDPYFGRFVDVTSDLMPTITIKSHHWKAGWRGKPYSQLANQIYVVLGGSGVSEVGDQRFDWSFGDVFVAPLACRVAHSASADARVVTLSDEGLMKWCGFYRLQDA
jgi:gentisate 1,2-dioxygenase